MTENRDTVLEYYSNLEKETSFNNITMRQFGLEIYNLMVINNPRSEKKASKDLIVIVNSVYMSNSTIGHTEKYSNLHSNLSESSKRQLPSSMRQYI